MGEAMRLHSVSVTNYKCFRARTTVILQPGFNIIIGRNNAGKSALIEALSLRFAGRPHRSAATIPHVSDEYDRTSAVEATIAMHGNELRRIAENAQGNFGVWVPSEFAA